MKTNKSYTKRIRVTRRGKLIARRPGQDHFNNRENAKTRTNKRRATQVSLSPHLRARFLPGKVG